MRSVTSHSRRSIFMLLLASVGSAESRYGARGTKCPAQSAAPQAIAYGDNNQLKTVKTNTTFSAGSQRVSDAP